MRAAHTVGFRSTAIIMFGQTENQASWVTLGAEGLRTVGRR